MDAFDVSGAARVAGWIEAELILAARAADRSDWEQFREYYVNINTNYIIYI